MKTQTIKATELNAGDIIAMEHGDSGNFLIGTVIETYEQNWVGLVIKFMYNDGTERIRECCAGRSGNVEKVVA